MTEYPLIKNSVCIEVDKTVLGGKAYNFSVAQSNV